MEAGRFLRSKRLRTQLYVAASGRCAMCGCDLGESFHADHIEAWKTSQTTNVHGMQALCAVCNGKKGAMVLKPRKFVSQCRSIALDYTSSGDARKMVALIECGSGKSSLPPTISYDLHRKGRIDGMLWAVPRKNLARQGAKGMGPGSFVWKLLGATPAQAKQYEINHLESGNVYNPSAGKFGYAVCYDSLRSNLTSHLEFMRSKRILLVADEAQFCAEGSANGKALAALMEAAAFSLLMSGDFDREDRRRVQGVTYEPAYDDEARLTDAEQVKCDVLYSIYDALDDRAILPIDFSYGSGSVVFHKNGVRHEVASFPDAGKDEKAAVWAALNSDYARDLLTECYRSWRQYRSTGAVSTGGRSYPANSSAQMMVVCANIVQAEAMRRFMLDRLEVSGADVAVVHSEEGDSADRLDSFCANKVPIVITVAMAYVGTDAPNASHLCCLTHIRSKPWIHQMLARVWRTSQTVAWGDNYCVAFVPDDTNFREIVEMLRRAAQAGADASDDSSDGGDDDAGEEDEGSGDRHPITVEGSMLTSLRLVREWGDDASGGVPSPGAPAEDTTRKLLIDAGYDAQTVDRMIAAASPVADPLTDARPVADRMKALCRQLEEYSRDTAHKYARLSGAKKTDGSHFKLANAELVRLTKKTREQMTEPDLLRALSHDAPRARTNLLARFGLFGAERG